MLIRTYADIERLEGEDALSEAEKKLIEGCKRGELTTLGNGSRPKRSSKARTIRADLLRYLILGGCEQCRVHEKGVQLEGAWIVGELDLSFASAKGAVYLLGCALAEPLVAHQASFDRLALNGSSLTGLNAVGATIRGSVFLRKLESVGEVSFAGTEIGGQLLCNGAELNGGERKALNADNAKIRGGVFLDNLKSTGEVSFVGAEIAGQLSAEEAELNVGQGRALNAQGATIRGGVFLKNLKSTGEVSLSNAEIGGQLSAGEAELHGGEGTALNAEGATISGDAFLENLRCTGEVSLSGAEIRGQLLFDGAELNGGEDVALNAQRIVVSDGLYWRHVKTVIGRVDVDTAQLGDLVDDEQSWESVPSLSLVGLTYEHLSGPLELTFRKRWLKKGAKFDGQFHPQPYQQLAKFYRETGHRYEAREILIEKEREQRKAAKSGLLVRLWDAAAEAVAGYGYKPWLSLWWLAGLVAVMMGMAQATWNAGDFAPNSAVILTSQDWKAIADGPSQNPAVEWSDIQAPGKDYETFYSFAYALDVVVPVLDLGQTDAWAPSPARGDWGWRLFYLQKMFIVLGWVVTAIAAAAISGMIRRDD